MTGPRREGMATSYLRQRGYEVLYLHYRDAVRHARRTKTILRSYFPRYIFVAVRASMGFHGVNRCPGVSTIVYCGDDPVEIPEGVIEELRKRGDNAGSIELTPEEKDERRRFEVGELVRINGGPLAGLVGAIQLDKGRLDSNGQVRVFIEMFKGSRVIPFRAGQLSPVRRSVQKRAP